MAKETHLEWLIIGAGPAGLQLGYYCQSHGINYLILEKTNNPGAFFKKFPRHKQLASVNKIFTGCKDGNINLRWDGNSLLTDENQFPFKNFSDKYHPSRVQMVRYLKEFAKHFKLNIKYQQHVVTIEKKAQFKVMTEKGDVYLCNKLFVATGAEKPYVPNIPGILFTRNYEDMPIEAKHYRNKRVLIIGKGDSAFETAHHLLGVASRIHLISPTPSQTVWQSPLGHSRAISSHLLEVSQAKSQNISLNATVKKIKLKEELYYVTFCRNFNEHEVETHTYDEVITCTGFQFNDSIFAENLKPALTQEGRYPKITSLYESTNIKGLFFIGALMCSRNYKENYSGFISGFRYNISFLFKHLLSEKQGVSHASIDLKDNIKNLAHQIIDRVNYSSSLWQQAGFFADIIVYEPQTNKFKYYFGVPLDFVREGRLVRNHHLFAITLEYGRDPLFCKKQPGMNCEETGLHPIVRHYYNSHLLSEHHLAENFENVWASRDHKEFLIDYLNQEMGPIRIERAVKNNEKF